MANSYRKIALVLTRDAQLISSTSSAMLLEFERYREYAEESYSKDY
jgi:hypothetical protein